MTIDVGSVLPMVSLRAGPQGMLHVAFGSLCGRQLGLVRLVGVGLGEPVAINPG